ncbi:MAG: TIGR00266 family protein [Candidatus Eisenbacteria bacterium]|nr:TIGR00266 family protein [Candidatus Eisenbacteria bacterium]
MRVDVRYQPSYSLAIVALEAEEAIQAEGGAMVSMTSNIEIQTGMKGGVFGALKRSVLGGESLFFNTFVSRGGPGEISLAPALPGDITAIELKGDLFYLQSGSYLASDPGIEIDPSWGGARTFFGSEGLFLLKARGQGRMVFSSYGAIHPVQISGAPYVVDTGHVVGFGGDLSFDVRRVGGWKSTILSGEGLVCEFRGSGVLYLQTRSTQSFLQWLIPHLPRGASSGGRGGGLLGGFLGNE